MASTGAVFSALTPAGQFEAQALNGLMAEGRDQNILWERERARRKEERRIGKTQPVMNDILSSPLNSSTRD